MEILMQRVTILLLIILILGPMPCWGADVTPDPRELLVLCYHSVQPAPGPDDAYTISQRRFAEQMDYLRTHDYQPVALEDVIEARRGGKKLPEKAVLLTFDDGYRSYGDFVVPLLELYGFPSMLAVVGSWIENGPPAELPEPLLTWPQLKKLVQHPLVALASHSFDLHRAAPYTPQGNVGALVAVRVYDGKLQRYETEEEYRLKLQNDFRQQEIVFQQRLGSKPQAMVWPYGHYNAISLETANAFGLGTSFALDEKGSFMADLAGQSVLNRQMVLNLPMDRFFYQLNGSGRNRDPIRAVQVDLDLVYSAASAREMDDNLGKLIDRLVQLKVNTVFLQAFADPEGTGNIRQVYFNNRLLPVRADIFAHAVHQIKYRGMKVFAWMPSLGFSFPDEGFNQTHGVRKREGEETVSGDRRLSPFSGEVRQRVAELYADLAMGAQISGVLFQDDAFLRDDEDFQPFALDAFSRHIGRKVAREELAPEAPMTDEWTRFKTQALMEYLDGLKAAVRRHRPGALFARNLYARLLFQPASEQWFAQNYARFLEDYDQVVVMAYPFMEQTTRPEVWLADLAAAAVRLPQARDKTIFKLQSYDWRRNQWVDEASLLRQMRSVLGAGIRHLAYYPDNFWADRPAIKQIRLEMSTRASIGDGQE
jgi:biofilm PGA synthesis lipoprotein PgaB